MIPFIYYVDCEGNLWVPCNCGCGGGNGYADIAYVNGRREYAGRAVERGYLARDSCVRRDYECIRPASESEKVALHREQDFEKLFEEALEAIKRLEKLHEGDL